MSAPQLTVATNGGAPVLADQLNTYVQSCDNVSELRGFVGITGMQVFIRGTTNPNDGGQGNFYWNSTGTAADDNGVTTVVPTGSGSGEWTRITTTPSGGNLSVSGTLTVTGSTTLNSTLTVAGATTFESTVQGFLNAFNNQVGTAYTLQASDCGIVVTFNNSSAVTVTLPNSLPVGFNCECINLGSGKVTFTAGSGSTLNNRSSQTSIAGQYGAVGLTVTSNAGNAAVYNLAGDTSS